MIREALEIKGEPNGGLKVQEISSSTLNESVQRPLN